jgi:hypothetical protein
MADRKADLEALRDLLWVSLQATDPDKRASLAAQYRGTLAELAELDRGAGKAGDPLDELTARRAARGVATSRKGRSAV